MKVDRSKKFSEFFERKSEPRNIQFLVLHHIEASSVEHASSFASIKLAHII
jgi:hypothetical protein